MDVNMWYYTSSTVAQTCGALVAIGGAVIIYKLDTIEKNLNDFRDRLIKTIFVPLKKNKNVSDINFYFKTSKELISEYNKLKKDNKIITKKGEVKPKIKKAIQKNYIGVTNTKAWIEGTYASLTSISHAKKYSFNRFFAILILLILATVSNIVLPICILPSATGSCIFFYIVEIYSIIAILSSVFLSWKILTKEIFDPKNKPEDK